jgi:hypothetical protein
MLMMWAVLAAAAFRCRRLIGHWNYCTGTIAPELGEGKIHKRKRNP